MLRRIAETVEPASDQVVGCLRRSTAGERIPGPGIVEWDPDALAAGRYRSEKREKGQEDKETDKEKETFFTRLYYAILLRDFRGLEGRPR